MRLSTLMLALGGVLVADYVVDEGLAVRQIGFANVAIYGSLAMLIVWLLQYRVVTRIGRQSVELYRRHSMQIAKRRSSMKLMRRRSIELEAMEAPHPRRTVSGG